MYAKSSLVALLGGLSVAVAQSSHNPSAEEIAKARATVKPNSPVSNVQGLSFNRFVNIWLENTVCFFFLRMSCAGQQLKVVLLLGL